jgi:thioredoxin reductase (NADPH)
LVTKQISGLTQQIPDTLPRAQLKDESDTRADVLVIGAGPTGLACAIEAQRAGFKTMAIDKGCVVNSIYHYPANMSFFTTPELLEIGGLPFVSPYDKPTRAEALRYYRAVVNTYDLQIAFDEKVLSIAREQDGTGVRGERGEAGEAGAHVFAVETRSSRGVRRVRLARHVVMAIGYYDRPVMLGIPGEDLPHVRHYYAEPHIHYRERVVIVGGGNSAAESALEMFRAGAHVTLVHRAPTLKSTIKYWVRPDIDNRLKEGSIAGRFERCVKEIRPTSVVLVGAGGTNGDEELPADAVYLLTGYRADVELMCRAGVMLDDRQAPVHDSGTFETNVPGLFVAGGAIAGVDTGTIFIENGRFHGEKIIEVIARGVES